MPIIQMVRYSSLSRARACGNLFVPFLGPFFLFNQKGDPDLSLSRSLARCSHRKAAMSRADSAPYQAKDHSVNKYKSWCPHSTGQHWIDEETK